MPCSSQIIFASRTAPYRVKNSSSSSPVVWRKKEISKSQFKADTPFLLYMEDPTNRKTILFVYICKSTSVFLHIYVNEIQNKQKCAIIRKHTISFNPVILKADNTRKLQLLQRFSCNLSITNGFSLFFKSTDQNYLSHLRKLQY